MIPKSYVKRLIYCIWIVLVPFSLIFLEASALIRKIWMDNVNLDLIPQPTISTDFYVCPQGRASRSLFWRDRNFIYPPYGNKNSSWNNPYKKKNINDLVVYDASVLAINDLNIANSSDEIEVIMEELLKKTYSTPGIYRLQSTQITGRRIDDGMIMKFRNNSGDSIEIETMLRDYWLLKDKNNNYYSSNYSYIYGTKNYGSIFPVKSSTGVRCYLDKNKKEYLTERTIYLLEVEAKNSYGEWLDVPATKILLILDSAVETFKLNQGYKPSF